MQENQSVLRDELQQTVKPNENLAQLMTGMGFDIELVRQALKDSTNDMQKAVENLLKMQADGSNQGALQTALETVSNMAAAGGLDMPSTSSQAVQNLEEEQQVRTDHECHQIIKIMAIFFLFMNHPNSTYI